MNNGLLELRKAANNGDKEAAKAVLYLCLLGDLSKPFRYKGRTIDSVVDRITDRMKSNKKIPLDATTRYSSYLAEAFDTTNLPSNSTILPKARESYKNALRANTHDLKQSLKVDLVTKKEIKPIVLGELDTPALDTAPSAIANSNSRA